MCITKNNYKESSPPNLSLLSVSQQIHRVLRRKSIVNKGNHLTYSQSTPLYISYYFF